ncbi:MAG: DeoR/GlpR transcriptional regulator, partial [Firmicutes bacterium]|nr:DeoR/GlpR transcriptional regulator [Bacillota bacterium]
RRNKIKEILLKQRSVKVGDLAAKFAVSEETIRRDLTALEQEGFVKKNYGGAVLVEDLIVTMAAIPPVQQRTMHLFEEKDAIGKKAASLVSPGQRVLIDAGSTTWCVARHLKNIPNLTIVTNGVNIVEEFSRSEGQELFMIGGKLVKKSMSLVGPQAEAEIRKYNAQIAFIGTSGISLTRGFTSSDIYEAEMKKAMVASADKVAVVADHTKFTRSGLLAFCALHEVDYLITSSLVEEAAVKEIIRCGVQVLLADVPCGTEQ